ncbi:MAG TPA: N-acetylmuramoyl-L-alanine amidase [Acidimicrobiia bacterium]|nr:N-acetylmuramoyl-L-alanine amidase [Acidimicrobiia bacterium]
MTLRWPALALAVSMTVLPPGGSFVDDDGNIHEGGIEAIAADGITSGCNPPANNRYCPGQTVTRGQMAAFIVRALDLAPAPDDLFTDDEGHIFEAAIDSLAAAGITVGCNPPANDRFCPDRPMTRAEMAAMLTRAFGYPPSAQNRFVDDERHLMEKAIDRFAAAGITVGCNPPANDRYCPDDPIARDQMATFLTRALGLTATRPPPRPFPVIAMVPREEWGALTPEPARMTPHVISRLTVHHAGSQSGVNGPAQFRGWQGWHMGGQDWPDIAYHLLIGIDGTVYEGRDPAYRGDTATSYDTTGHLLVVVEGNFEVERPTAAQIDSLEAVLAWASEHYDVSPATIAGHGDYAATSCPGRNLESRIHSGELQESVETIIEQGGAELIWP